MTQLTSLPISSDNWVEVIERSLELVHEAAKYVFYSRNKVEYIEKEMKLFLDSLKICSENCLSNKQIMRLFEYVKATTAFIGILSTYQPKTWLSHFLNSRLNQSFLDIRILWDAWSDASTAFCYHCFQDIDGLAHAHSLDLIFVVQFLSKYFDKINKSVQPSISAKIDQINDIIQPPKFNTPQTETNTNLLQHSNWEIVNPQIGQGGYATVRLAKLKNTGEQIAVKELTATQLTPRRINYLKREINTMRRLKHPNLLNLIGVTVTPPFCIATDYLPNGSLYDLIHTNKITDNSATMIAVDVARALEYLHAQGMIHRDLKPPNILLNGNYRAIVCDFGLTRMTSPLMTTELGTIQWMAPEVLRSNGKYDNAIDIYAYGMILYEMATQKAPFDGLKSMQIASMVINGERPDLKETRIPQKLQELITKCWDHDPSKRPSMHQIVNEFEQGNIVFGNADPTQIRQWSKKTAPPHKDAMDAIAKQPSDSQILVARLANINPLDPLAVPTLQKILELKVEDPSVINDAVILATQKSSDEVAKLALKVIEQIIQAETISASLLGTALLKLWDTQPSFVVTHLRKVATRIENKQTFIRILLTEKAQTDKIVDAIEAIADVEDLPIIFEYLEPSLVVQTLSVCLTRFQPNKMMASAAVSSMPALSLMLRQVLKSSKLESIYCSEKQYDDIESITAMLNTGYFMNNAKDIQKVITTLTPLFLAGGPGLATMEILKAGAQFPNTSAIITKDGYWNLIVKSLSSPREDIVIATVDLMLDLKLSDHEIKLVWDSLLECFVKTHHDKALKLIQQFIKQLPSLNITGYLLGLITGFGLNSPRNEGFMKIAFAVNLKQKGVLKIDKSFWRTVSKSVPSMNSNGAAGVALFVLKWKSETRNNLVSFDLMGELLGFLYRQTAPFTCVIPVLQYLLNEASDKEACIFLVHHHFIRYLHQLPVRYPNDQRITNVLLQFANLFENVVSQTQGE